MIGPLPRSSYLRRRASPLASRALRGHLARARAQYQSVSTARRAQIIASVARNEFASGQLVSSNATVANTIIFAKWACLHEACHDKMIAAHFYQGSEPSSQPSPRTLLSQPSRVSTMEAKSRRLKGRENTVSTLNVAIEALDLAKELSSITPARAVFGSVSVILVMIRVGFFLAFID